MPLFFYVNHPSEGPPVYTYAVFFSKMNIRYNLLLVGGTNMLDITQIKEIIPHRYPFLLIDKILEVEEGQKAIGIKNVTANEAVIKVTIRSISFDFCSRELTICAVDVEER